MVKTWRRYNWDGILIDEAHRFSSPTGEMSKCLGRLNSKSTIMLTGTPVQSNVSQLVRLLQICDLRLFEDLFLEKCDIFEDLQLQDLWQQVFSRISK